MMGRRLFSIVRVTTFAAILIAIPVIAYGSELEFPDEELARESVLPVFEKPQSVMNRNINNSERFELGLGMGLEVNEPFYNDLVYQLQGTYHRDDTSAYNLQGIFWSDGLSSYGEQLASGGSGGNTFPKFDATKAPHPKWALIGNYEFTAYYGKISLSKQSVMHLNLFAIAGLGYLNMDSLSTILANIGLGQNFYFTKNFALRMDIRWLIFRGPNAASKQLTPTDNPSASSFENRMYFNTQIGVSGVFIL